ncbi:hypothetical protein T4B_1789 [Trichinella pseudospiralis]|uniref:Uncharacterized protein n=1 Tax=Trichinella pseudospiralis TaxID=6337 RepID=A0A0V1H005_TRIPS|nr:hypothetical protein T4B_9449 [Trichinella pseudospiralis]KRZ30285.1 hypothetical protein T4B_1789 [Trichinella pseudospiralis]
MSSIQRERGHKITEDALDVSMSINGERNAVCVAVRRKTLGAQTAKEVHRGGMPETVPQLAPANEPWQRYTQRLEAGAIKEFVRSGGGQIPCSAVLCGGNAFVDAGIMENAFDVDVSSSQKQGLTFPKDKRRLVATKSLTPLRYCGGTCSGCADATFESETKRRLYECTANGCGRQSYCRIQLMNYGNTPSGL